MKKLLFYSAFALLSTLFCQPIVAQTGNVGIGTTDPQAKLHVAGDMQVDNRLVLKDSLDNDRIIIDPDNALFQMLDTSGNVIFNLSINGEEQSASKGMRKGSPRNTENATTPTFSWSFNTETQSMNKVIEYPDNSILEEGYSLLPSGSAAKVLTDENGVIRFGEEEWLDEKGETYFDENGNKVAERITTYENGESKTIWEFFEPTNAITPKKVIEKDLEGIKVKDPAAGDKLTLDAIGIHTENLVTLTEFFADCFGISKFGPGQFVGIGLNLSDGSIIIEGDLDVQGDISKSGGTFKIDHPQDPTNKGLYHSFVESPDRMNVYNGNITTNSEGEEIVELPGYFEDLNKDFRYQLSVIGTFAQAIISEEVKNNKFKIKTSKPNVKVSWQVTGIRQDDFAKDNPIEVEAPKTGWDRGKRLYDLNRKTPYTKDLQNHQTRVGEN